MLRVSNFQLVKVHFGPVGMKVEFGNYILYGIDSNDTNPERLLGNPGPCRNAFRVIFILCLYDVLMQLSLCICLQRTDFKALEKILA